VDRRVDLVIDPLRGDKVPISLPLRFRTPVEQTRRELGFADWVDASDPIVAQAIALAGAARRAEPPIDFAVFGGVAHRLRCRSSNDAATGLRHPVHDLDLAIRLKDARTFQRWLAGVARSAGSALTFFETPGDKIYNSLSGGRRLRWHMVPEMNDAQVTLGTLDLVADVFEFCHRIDVRGDVDRGAVQGWTLEPAHLLLTKAQYLLRVPKGDATAIADRVLEPFGRSDVLIGPEAKDVRDLLALLHDHPVEESAAAIAPSALRSALEDDWGLWKTVGLTLGMVARSPILRSAPGPLRSRIEPRLAQVREIVAAQTPKRRFAIFGGAWWQDVDTPPSTDTTVGVG